MRSRPIGNGQLGSASQLDSARDDARAGSFLLPHQMLGTLALGTEPTNGQTVSLVINGTTITATAVTTIGSTANNVLIGGSALAFVTNLINWARRPDLTTSTQVAASSANQTLLSYVGWAWPGSSTNIVPFSLNKNVNGNTDILTSFNITTTVSSGTWTAGTLKLYIQDGTYYVGTTRVLFTGGSTPSFTAPSSHPRIDIVTADSSGTIAITQGTESATPSAPSYPANKMVICEVYNVVGETGIFDNENQQSAQGYIYNDVRGTPVYISSTSQVGSGLFLLDPGGEAQGAVPFQGSAALKFLAPGALGLVLTAQGASSDVIWGPVASAQHLFTAGFSNAANTSEQTVDSYTVPANSLGTAHYIHAKYFATQVGSGTGTLTLRAYYGTTVIATFTTGGGFAVGGSVEIDIYVISGGTTSSQNGQLKMFSKGSNGVFSTSSDIQWNGSGTATVDSTSNQTFKLTLQTSTNNGAGTSLIQYGLVELL